MKKFDRLFQQDFKIVENKKAVFITPLILILIAVVAGVIFHFTSGSAFNLGMDFTGGYSISIQLGSKLTDDTYEEYKDLAVDVIEDLKDENGKSYGIKVSSVQRQGETDTAGLLIKYKAVASETKMEEINDQLQEELADTMFVVHPTIKYNAAKTEFTADYADYALQGRVKEDIELKLADAGYANAEVTVSEDRTSVSVVLGAAVADEAAMAELLSVADNYGGMVNDGGQTSSTVSSEILKSALLAVSIALLCMLVYIVIRFELLSGIAAVAALAHDIVIMFACMVIFHIEINATFIAALITILGYSINNTIIIFDRVRENIKFYNDRRINGKRIKPDYIANKSVQETVWRSINTTITTLIMIAMVAIIGVSSIRVFALPIIFGLLAGTYSSVFMAPTIWAMLAKAFPGTMKVKAPKAAKAKRASAKTDK